MKKIAGILFAVVLTFQEALSIAGVVYSEANTESDLGKCLVIDCILNRVEDKEFPATISGVITQKGQFAKGNPDKAGDLVPIVYQEAKKRTNVKVLWFRKNKYHSWGSPILKEGKHYFSGR